jgi:hypothetical protein
VQRCERDRQHQRADCHRAHALSQSLRVWRTVE